MRLPSLTFIAALLACPAHGDMGNTAKRIVTWGAAGKVETFKEGKDACDRHWDKTNANDPCNQAHVFEASAKSQAFAAKAYSVASVICLTECVANTGGTACLVSGLGAAAAETVNALRVKAASDTVMSQIGGPLATAGLALGADKAGASKRTQSCMAFGMNALQSTVRWANHGSSLESANESYRQKLEMMSQAPQLEMAKAPDGTSNGASSNNGTDSTQNIGGINDSMTEKSAANAADKSFEENAAEMGQIPMLRAFEKLTGKPASGLDERINAGMPPLIAAADMAAGALGPQGMQALSAFASQSDDLAAKMKPELDMLDKETGLAATSFESGGRAGSRAAASDDMAMPDLQAIMSQFMPQKPGEEKPNSNVAQVQYGARQLAAQTSERGIHAPARSIFDIVGSRYQLLSQKFLTGENIRTGAPQSLLPANPYLRK